MKRQYQSRRREASAAYTRQAIVEAAVHMHGQGVTTLSAVAEAAGVALPTVTKHFPTREDLFVACTSHVAANLPLPSLDELAAIADPGERILRGVRAVFTLHEQTFGTMWTGYRLSDESPVLAQAIADYDNSLAGAVAEVLLKGTSSERDCQPEAGFFRALLSALSYRALRRQGGLTPEDAIQQTARALAAMIGAKLPPA